MVGDCGTSYFMSSSTVWSGCTNFSMNFAFDYARLMIESWNYQTHQAFIKSLVRVEWYNPLPILMRAVNALKLHRMIKQPCWRAERWKSLT